MRQSGSGRKIDADHSHSFTKDAGSITDVPLRTQDRTGLLMGKKRAAVDQKDKEKRTEREGEKKKKSPHSVNPMITQSKSQVKLTKVKIKVTFLSRKVISLHYFFSPLLLAINHLHQCKVNDEVNDGGSHGYAYIYPRQGRQERQFTSPI